MSGARLATVIVAIIALAHEARVIALVLTSLGKRNPEAWLIRQPAGARRWWQAARDGERRFWLYALMIRTPDRQVFEGLHHDGAGLQGGNAGSWKGWAIINLIPAPIIHLLIHHHNPVAADIVSLSCILGSAWLWSEYRAHSIRPLSMDHDFIHLRYGLLIDRKIRLGEVVGTKACSYRDPINTATRYAGLGHPNILIDLSSGERIAIGVDHPESFVRALNSYREAAPLPATLPLAGI